MTDTDLFFRAEGSIRFDLCLCPRFRYPQDFDRIAKTNLDPEAIGFRVASELFAPVASERSSGSEHAATPNQMLRLIAVLA